MAFCHLGFLPILVQAGGGKKGKGGGKKKVYGGYTMGAHVRRKGLYRYDNVHRCVCGERLGQAHSWNWILQFEFHHASHNQASTTISSISAAVLQSCKISAWSSFFLQGEWHAPMHPDIRVPTRE
mmetsp:Transcript_12911/g.26795  ORF Transcript_12911/g.26795 Transcript_12911/m.26795 type:complete len:125 (-) Transcript_12911:2103-2477(-)